MEKGCQGRLVFSHTVTLWTSEENLQKGVVVHWEPVSKDPFILSANDNGSTGCILFFCDYIVVLFRYTVKPLYSGHHWDCEKVSAIEKCPLHRDSSQICLFCSKNIYFATKTCFGVLGHCKIDTIV